MSNGEMLIVAFLIVVNILMLLGIVAHKWGYNARQNEWTQPGGYDPRNDWNGQ
jgi:hypothetical protein